MSRGRHRAVRGRHRAPEQPMLAELLDLDAVTAAYVLALAARQARR